MKTLGLLVFALVLVLLVDDSFGIWRRRCRFRCWRRCRWYRGRYRCRFYCGLKCKFGKRQAIEAGGHNTPLPAGLGFYDLNDDGYVELEEFADTLGEDPDEPGLVKGFNATDVNNDGKLSWEELTAETSAFVLEKPFEQMQEDDTTLTPEH